MAGYTDAEIDKVALAMVNSERKEDGSPPLERLGNVENPGYYRRLAEVGLAAREDLFDVRGERWEIQDGEGYCYPKEDAEAAHAECAEMKANGFDLAVVVHIVTKRRKR